MKNLSIVLNVILLVAVVILYVLYFQDRKGSVAANRVSDTSSVNLNIAYINLDSVLRHYEFMKVNRDKFEAKGKQMDQDYRNRAMGWQKEVDVYKNNLPNMTFAQQKATEEDLSRKQQNLQMYQQSLAQQLAQEEAKLTQDLYERLTGYLKTYAEENDLKMVLKYDPGSDVMYGTPAIDITQNVITGLNAAYTAEKNSAETTGKK